MYSVEQYNRDKFVVDEAQIELNRAVIGEGDGRLAQYAADYARICGYFAHGVDDSSLPSKTPYISSLARMFYRLSSTEKLDGTYVQPYMVKFQEIYRKLKSKRVFRRKPKIKCFAPREHKQPCYCAGAEAVAAIAQTLPEQKEQIAAQVNSQLILDNRQDEERELERVKRFVNL
jgi:hypothetical protein